MINVRITDMSAYWYVNSLWSHKCVETNQSA